MGTSYIVTEERMMPFPFIRSTESPNRVITINRDFLEKARRERAKGSASEICFDDCFNGHRTGAQPCARRSSVSEKERVKVPQRTVARFFFITFRAVFFLIQGKSHYHLFLLTIAAGVTESDGF